MTMALRTVIEEWALPWMNARVIKASAMVENEGSLRVLKKNGFQLETTVNWQQLPASKGQSVNHVLRWVAPDQTDNSCFGGVSGKESLRNVGLTYDNNMDRE